MRSNELVRENACPGHVLSGQCQSSKALLSLLSLYVQHSLRHLWHERHRAVSAIMALEAGEGGLECGKAQALLSREEAGRLILEGDDGVWSWAVTEGGVNTQEEMRNHGHVRARAHTCTQGCQLHQRLQEMRGKAVPSELSVGICPVGTWTSDF